MAVVTSDFLAGLYQTFKALYKDTYEKTQVDWPKIAMQVPSATSQNDYSWLGEVPGMKEWVDERTIEDLKAWDYTIKNKDWESTIGVDRNTIEDDQLGIINPRIQGLADAARTHPDQLVFQLLDTGFDEVCFDGQYFFDTDHPLEDGSTQSNKITTAFGETGFQEALVLIRKMKGWTGRALNINGPFTLVVSPQDEVEALKLATNSKLANGEDNPYKALIKEVIVRADITDGRWFLLCTNKPIKPLILQMRKQPEFVAQDDPTKSETVFMRKKFLYGVDARYNVGFGLYQLAVGSTGTGA